MKVLWFAVTPSLYGKNTTSHNGGGWIASLETLIRNNANVQLAIAFQHEDYIFKVERDKVVYYPINIWKSRLNRLKRKFCFELEEKLLLPHCKRIVDDFEPDVIHIFGSEWCFGLITHYTKIPVVIHMQGCIPAYYNARFPSGYSKSDLFFYNKLHFKRIFFLIIADNFFRLRAIREAKILKNCKYFMGRTEWDRNITRLYSPNSTYFYCSEAIRTSFFTNKHIWTYPTSNKKIVLATTISSPLYKGGDLVLKTAKLLSENSNLNFEWRIFGVNEFSFHEKINKIKASSVNIKLMGTLSADNLCEELLKSNVFIHPSYIDNSPNSVCEAQLLGIPVISTNVGGVASLISHNETGMLVPANDPFSLASYIILLNQKPELAMKLGANARELALKRHNPSVLIDNLLFIYKDIVCNETKD